MEWTRESAKARDVRKNAELASRWQRDHAWHPWFAWCPVTITENFAVERRVWLQWVSRRLINRYDDEQPPPWWAYDLCRWEYR